MEEKRFLKISDAILPALERTILTTYETRRVLPAVTIHLSRGTNFSFSFVKLDQGRDNGNLDRIFRGSVFLTADT